MFFKNFLMFLAIKEKRPKQAFFCSLSYAGSLPE
jgi:hypothetical protein